MIDLHTHLLPGVDDGARSMEVAVACLARLSAEGVTRIVCTPHLRASAAGAAPYAAHGALLDELRTSVGPAGPTLAQGWEIMLDTPGVDLSAPQLRLAGANAVLVEFPHSGVPLGSTAELARIRRSGVVPVVAHPERYWGNSLTLVREWREAGAVMQGDATILLGGGDRGRLGRALLGAGLLDVVASDNHGDRRSIAAVRQWLQEIGAPVAATRLTEQNASLLLADEPLQPVPPVSVDRSLTRRLRDLLFGAS